MSSRMSSCLLNFLTFRFHRRLCPLSCSSFSSSSPRIFIFRACCARKRACCTYSDQLMVRVGRAKKAEMRSTGKEDSPMPPQMRNVHHPTAENRATACGGISFSFFRSFISLHPSWHHTEDIMETAGPLRQRRGEAHLVSGKGEGRGV